MDQKPSSEKTEQEVNAEGDKIRTLYVEREELMKEASRIQIRLSEIDSIVSTFFQPVFKLDIPKSGVALEMAKVMSEDVPMTFQEIIDAMVKNKIHPHKQTVRQYLTYIACFERVRKWKPFGRTQAGWICHKNILQ